MFERRLQPVPDRIALHLSTVDYEEMEDVAADLSFNQHKFADIRQCITSKIRLLNQKKFCLNHSI